jgi:hypothetical protein
MPKRRQKQLIQLTPTPNEDERYTTMTELEPHYDAVCSECGEPWPCHCGGDECNSMASDT